MINYPKLFIINNTNSINKLHFFFLNNNIPSLHYWRIGNFINSVNIQLLHNKLPINSTFDKFTVFPNITNIEHVKNIQKVNLFCT